MNANNYPSTKEKKRVYKQVLEKSTERQNRLIESVVHK